MAIGAAVEAGENRLRVRRLRVIIPAGLAKREFGFDHGETQWKT
ncbi:MAG: hypothetical protein WCB11_13335 [Terriglobales bacterium]